jgi:hypothetical protein
MRVPMSNRRWLIAAVAALASIVGTAASASVAVVEDVTGPVQGVQSFDFLDEGRVIRVAPGATIVISYLRSCIRETIVGGTVRVGAEQSQVENGQVGRERVDCDGGRMRLSADQAARGGVMVFRTSPGGLPPPRAMIFSMTPVVMMGQPGPLSFERLDRAAERIELNVSAEEMRQGMYDLSRSGRMLAPGGLYRARSGDREIVFRVDAIARGGPQPLVSRLLQF